MIQETLVFDIEHSGIGILCVEDGSYHHYPNDELIKAANRLINAKHVISFNGKTGFDQTQLHKILNLPHHETVSFKGSHDDMMEICYKEQRFETDGNWNVGYFGMGLRDIYLVRFKDTPPLPDTEGGHLFNDVIATYRLWVCWKNDVLLMDFIEDKHSAIQYAKKMTQKKGLMLEDCP